MDKKPKARSVFRLYTDDIPSKFLARLKFNAEAKGNKTAKTTFRSPMLWQVGVGIILSVSPALFAAQAPNENLEERPLESRAIAPAFCQAGCISRFLSDAPPHAPVGRQRRAAFRGILSPKVSLITRFRGFLLAVREKTPRPENKASFTKGRDSICLSRVC